MKRSKTKCECCGVRHGIVIRRRRDPNRPDRCWKNEYRQVRRTEMVDYRIQTRWLPPEIVRIQLIGSKYLCWICEMDEYKRQKRRRKKRIEMMLFDEIA